jgi:hypothetical protein
MTAGDGEDAPPCYGARAARVRRRRRRRTGGPRRARTYGSAESRSSGRGRVGVRAARAERALGGAWPREARPGNVLLVLFLK